MTTENQCSGKVWPAGSYRSSPCPNRARFKHGNLWFCGGHNPDSVAERRRKQAEKNEPKVKARAAKFRLERAAPDLKAVAEMVLATATIETPKELVNAASAAIAKAEGR